MLKQMTIFYVLAAGTQPPFTISTNNHRQNKVFNLCACFFFATLFHTFSLSLAFSLSLLLVRVHCNVLVFLIGRVLKFKLWVWLHLNQSNKISLLFFASQLQNPMISNKYFHFSFYTFIWIFNVFPSQMIW